MEHGFLRPEGEPGGGEEWGTQAKGKGGMARAQGKFFVGFLFTESQESSI